MGGNGHHSKEMLRKNTWFCSHRGPIDTIPSSGMSRTPHDSSHRPSTYLVLAISTQKVSFSQPGDDGLGVPERHAGQGDAAAFLRLYVLRRCLREGGGSWGAEDTTVTPPRPLWVSGRHRDRGNTLHIPMEGAGAPQKRAGLQGWG